MRRYPTSLSSYNNCTRIIKLDTETEVNSLISKLCRVGSKQINMETGGEFGCQEHGRPDNKVGNWVLTLSLPPGGRQECAAPHDVESLVRRGARRAAKHDRPAAGGLIVEGSAARAVARKPVQPRPHHRRHRGEVDGAAVGRCLDSADHLGVELRCLPLLACGRQPEQEV
jgi:hypothetical protein